MRIFRIARAVHAAEPLSGRGGLAASGRWHTRGRPIVYASATISLAVLEMLVHAGRRGLPADAVVVEFDVPEEVPVDRITPDQLPATWRSYPAPPELAALGDRWLAGRSAALLTVPSAVVPRESNLLINPDHPHAARVGVVSSEPFTFDPRLGGAATQGDRR